jgi:hypothetical protein
MTQSLSSPVNEATEKQKTSLSTIAM